jgi:DNA-directed RNA polymerase subunit M/transcription elongation factor TFIIS
VEHIVKALAEQLENLKAKEESLHKLLTDVAHDLNGAIASRKSVLTALTALDPKLAKNLHPVEHVDDYGSLLGRSEGSGPDLRTTTTGYLQVESEPAAVSPPSQPVTIQDAGPECSSCGERKLYYMTRELSSGRQVNLMVCGECSNERIM